MKKLRMKCKVTQFPKDAGIFAITLHQKKIPIF